MKSASALLFLTTIAVSAGPPGGAYPTWVQTKFPDQYGNAALEATVWGDRADPDGDGCCNLLEFMMAREPNIPDAHLGPQVRTDGNDLVIVYRETTVPNHGVTWSGEWALEFSDWLPYGVRYQALSNHTGYRMVEARISRNRETVMFFRMAATR